MYCQHATVSVLVGIDLVCLSKPGLGREWEQHMVAALVPASTGHMKSWWHMEVVLCLGLWGFVLVFAWSSIIIGEHQSYPGCQVRPAPFTKVAFALWYAPCCHNQDTAEWNDLDQL